MFAPLGLFQCPLVVSSKKRVLVPSLVWRWPEVAELGRAWGSGPLGAVLGQWYMLGFEPLKSDLTVLFKSSLDYGLSPFKYYSDSSRKQSRRRWTRKQPNIRKLIEVALTFCIKSDLKLTLSLFYCVWSMIFDIIVTVLNDKT